ncbi:hypothetical protein ACPC54_37240 [Kitasatospora sp. NPDC094028]
MPTTPPDFAPETVSPAGPPHHHTLGPHALFDLHHHRYHAYADLLLAPDDAHLALRATRGYLEDEWAQAARANPAAFAWQALRHRVCLLAGPGPLRPLVHLGPRQQDIVLLHHALAMRAQEIAAVMGTEAAAVHAEILALAHPRHS